MAPNQCFGAGSKSGSALDPYSSGYWIRIRIANADPDPEGGKSAQKRRKLSQNRKKIKIGITGINAVIF
jgi:hypothetical protein